MIIVTESDWLGPLFSRYAEFNIVGRAYQRCPRVVFADVYTYPFYQCVTISASTSDTYPDKTLKEFCVARIEGPQIFLCTP